MILEVTQEALDLNYDGMIIETHYDPDNAWSDAAQHNCIETNFVDLKVRKVDDMSTEFTQKMKKLRANIDVLDASLLDLWEKNESG
jgi:chorismate mutase